MEPPRSHDGGAPRAPSTSSRPRKPSASHPASSRATPKRPASRAAPPPLDEGRPGSPGLIGGLGGLLRGSSSKLGQISGLDIPARSFERLALAAERGALLIDRFENEVGLDSALIALERLDRAVTLLETIGASLEAVRREGAQMRASLAEIEARLADLHAHNAWPLDGLPPTRGRRPRGAGPTPRG